MSYIPPLKYRQQGVTKATYTSWMQMKARVRDCRSYLEDKSWNSFDAFFADMGNRPEGKTLDRENNNRGYCKANCRWATSQEQNRNRGGYNVKFAKDGIVASAEYWAKKLNRRPTSIYKRPAYYGLERVQYA